MDIGTGIAAGSVTLASTAVVFKIINAYAISKNGNGNGNGKHCKDHSGICIKQDSFDAWLNKIETKLDRVIERRTLSR